MGWFESYACSVAFFGSAALRCAVGPDEIQALAIGRNLELYVSKAHHDINSIIYIILIVSFMNILTSVVHW